MAPDFDKIQANMTSGLQKTQKTNQKEEQSLNAQQEQGLTFRGAERTDLGMGVAGKSSIKIDNFDTDMTKFGKNYQFAQATNAYIDSLVAQGYSLDEAVSAVYGELGN